MWFLCFPICFDVAFAQLEAQFQQQFALFFVRVSPSAVAQNCGCFGPKRKLEQAFTVDCFDDIVLLMPLLAPAAS